MSTFVVLLMTYLATSLCIKLPDDFQHPVSLKPFPSPPALTIHRRRAEESIDQPKEDISVIETTRDLVEKTPALTTGTLSKVDRNKLDPGRRNIEPEPSGEVEGRQSTLRKNLLQRDHGLVTTALLRDIRDVLQSHKHEVDLEQRLETVTHEVNAMGGEVSKLEQSVEQQVDFLRDSLVALRMVMAGQAQQLSVLNHRIFYIPLLLPNELENSSQAWDEPSPPTLNHFSSHTSTEKPVSQTAYPLVNNSTSDVTLPNNTGNTQRLVSLPHTSQSLSNYTNDTYTHTEILKNNTPILILSNNSHTSPDLVHNTQSPEPTNIQTPPDQIDNPFTSTDLSGSTDINTVKDPNQSNTKQTPAVEHAAEDPYSLAAIGAQVSTITQQLKELQAHLHEVQESVAQLKVASKSKEVIMVQDVQDNQEFKQDVIGNENQSYLQDKANLELKHSNSTKEGIHIDILRDSVEILKEPENIMEDAQDTKESKDPSSSKPQDIHQAATMLTCKCSTEDLKNAISDLQEVQRHHRDRLDLMVQNLTLLQNNTIGPSSFSSSSGEYTQRVGEAEGVNILMEDLKKLKEEMENDLAERETTIVSGTNNSYISGSSSSTTQKQGLCVWPFQRGSGGCFYVHQEERLAWGAAKEHCQSLQGTLATPTSFSALQTYLLKQRLTRAYTYWLGASNTGEEGSWEWSDGRSVEPEVWEDSSAPPTHTRIHSQRCLAIKPGYKMVTSSESCRETRFFICQQERLL
ncbi:hypothetical protein Pmani_027704 [Petrolisthes manimaculis]|uniref:C-type lectin domain-containing protein n=1 Tax=Petrolisthes manimaculis TaxID=1843537 RepID=A0AAE1P0U5_9EUCA|nr:hypothetical protein Pmani_027704 [Petrolisthes manimaculis]